MRQAAVVVILALAAGAAYASNLQDDDSAAHKAACLAVQDRKPPAEDRPTAAQSRVLTKCDAEAFYYGEKGPPDYVRARLCALARDPSGAPGQDVFHNDVILMQIYANGLGVPRDLDLALAYACNDDAWAPAEFSGRLDDLIARRDHPVATRFDYCDDVTSGTMQGMCAARDSQIAKQARARAFDSLAARLPPGARAAYAQLQNAAEAFASAHGDGEVDVSGSGRAAFEIEAEDGVRTAFRRHLEAVLDKIWPVASPQAAQKADADLNTAYRETLAGLGRSDLAGTIAPRGVRAAQRLWLAYRDAFIRFAHQAAPGTPTPSILAELTSERTKALREIAP